MAESSAGYEDIGESREQAGRDEKERVKWKGRDENEQVPYCIAVSTVWMHCTYAQW